MLDESWTLSSPESCGFAEILMAGGREGRVGPGQSWTEETASLGTRKGLVDPAQEPSPNLSFSSLSPLPPTLTPLLWDTRELLHFVRKAPIYLTGRYKS